MVGFSGLVDGNCWGRERNGTGRDGREEKGKEGNGKGKGEEGR